MLAGYMKGFVFFDWAVPTQMFHSIWKGNNSLKDSQPPAEPTLEDVEGLGKKYYLKNIQGISPLVYTSTSGLPSFAGTSAPSVPDAASSSSGIEAAPAGQQQEQSLLGRVEGVKIDPQKY